MNENLIHRADDQTFQQEVLQSDLPVLVDFWAEWCGPCKMIAPLLTQIAEAYRGRLKVVKVNIDEAPRTPQQYGVRGIPTLMIFKNGEVVATRVGAMSKAELESFINANL